MKRGGSGEGEEGGEEGIGEGERRGRSRRGREERKGVAGNLMAV